MNMNKLSIMLILLPIVFSCNQEEKKQLDTFTVSGTIKGLDTDYMSTSYTDESGKRIKDSVIVQNNKFTYTAKITKPTHIVFWPWVERTMKRTDDGFIPAKSSQFAFLASPGDNIVFNGEVTDFVNAYPTGSKANDDLALINRKVFPLLNKSVNMLLEKRKIAEEDSLTIKALEDSISKLDDEIIRLKKGFISSNQNSEAAVWYLSDMMMRHQISDEAAIKMYKQIDLSLKENPHYKEIASRVNGIEATLIGNVLPDFTTKNTMDGTEFEFNSLRGKYILIDFWGTWCGPCVVEMPKLKEYQEKYKEQLVVLGINSGDTKEKIEKFITSKNYTWKQLLSGEGADNLVLKLNVTGFPTKFIIDPSGEILYKFVGGGEDAFAALDDLLILPF